MKTFNHEELFKKTKNDKKVIELIKMIEILLPLDKREFFRKKFLLTGGYLRDRIKNQKITDYDFVLNTKIFHIVANILEKNKFILKIDKLRTKPLEQINFNYLTIFFYQDLEIQIKEIKCDPKKNMDFDFIKDSDFDLIQDLKFRDFTINSLYYNLFTDEIFDFCNGVEDLKNNIIVTVNSIDKTFSESFPRFFRFARYYVDFKTNGEMIKFIIQYFSNEKNYLEILSDKIKFDDIKRQLKKVFYYPNTGEIINIMMLFQIFNVFL